MDYRSDLTGLRALAVAAVVLFHFGVSGFSGGFAGVDVFFVISGYLMTGIIAGGLAAGRFSLSTFYLSRAKRIIPALAVLCLLLLVLGLLYLGKRDFYSLSKHVVASILFLSNFTYKNEAGYFDADSHEKWLLHTWSLSVEWQFYLLYPLLLVALAKYYSPTGRAFRNGLWALSLLSFIACVAVTRLNPSSAFFLLPTRAWELLAGGLVYLYSSAQFRIPAAKTFEIAGLGMIAAAIFALDSASDWPGYWAALPVVGTCLILLAAPTSFWSSNPLSQAIGKWSYSIYLWHWPIFVAGNYFDWGQSAVHKVFMIVAAVGMGYLSYRFVEEPCRHSAFARTLNWEKAGLMVSPAILLGLAGIVGKGLPARLPPEVAAIETDPAYLRGNPLELCHSVQKRDGTLVCSIGQLPAAPAVAVLGDSHAGALLHAVKQAAKSGGTNVLALPGAACPPIEGVQAIAGIPGEACRNYVATAAKLLDETPAISSVILIARWSAYVEGYVEKSGGPYALFDHNGVPEADARRAEYRRRLLSSLCNAAAKRTVYVVLPIPEHTKNVPRELARRMMTGSHGGYPVVSVAEYGQRHAAVLQAFGEAQAKCGVQLLDPLPYLCARGSCSSVLDGRPLYYDDDHLNEFGNRLLVRMMRGVKEFSGEAGTVVENSKQK
ncbi:MAG: acyltransferase family protein [Pseudomonadota bacterium]